MNEKVTMRDLVLIGRTAPVISKKHGKIVCGIAYSPSIQGLIRIYPLPINMGLSRRGIFDALLEKTTKDSRDESYKLLKHSKQKGDIPLKKMKRLMDDLVYPLQETNNEKKSITVLRTNGLETILTEQEIGEPDTGGFMVVPNYPKIPRIVLKTGYRQFRFQWREWGIFELMRRKIQEGNEKEITEEYISRRYQDKVNYLVLGNLVSQRTTWVVCEIYSFKN